MAHQAENWVCVENYKTPACEYVNRDGSTCFDGRCRTIYRQGIGPFVLCNKHYGICQDCGLHLAVRNCGECGNRLCHNHERCGNHKQK